MNSVHDVDLLEVFKDKKEESVLLGGVLFVVTLALFIIALAILGPVKCFGDEIGTCSWYTYQSTIKEGNSGICADGSRMDDNALVAASWSYPLGSFVRVTSMDSGKSIIVRIRDRGPAKRLVKKGRIIDLSRHAFSKLVDCKRGLIKVRVEKING